MQNTEYICRQLMPKIFCIYQRYIYTFRNFSFLILLKAIRHEESKLHIDMNINMKITVVHLNTVRLQLVN